MSDSEDFKASDLVRELGLGSLSSFSSASSLELDDFGEYLPSSSNHAAGSAENGFRREIRGHDPQRRPRSFSSDEGDGKQSDYNESHKDLDLKEAEKRCELEAQDETTTENKTQIQGVGTEPEVGVLLIEAEAEMDLKEKEMKLLERALELRERELQLKNKTNEMTNKSPNTPSGFKSTTFISTPERSVTTKNIWSGYFPGPKPAAPKEDSCKACGFQDAMHPGFCKHRMEHLRSSPGRSSSPPLDQQHHIDYSTEKGQESLAIVSHNIWTRQRIAELSDLSNPETPGPVFPRMRRMKEAPRFVPLAQLPSPQKITPSSLSPISNCEFCDFLSSDESGCSELDGPDEKFQHSKEQTAKADLTVSKSQLKRKLMPGETRIVSLSQGSLLLRSIDDSIKGNRFMKRNEHEFGRVDLNTVPKPFVTFTAAACVPVSPHRKPGRRHNYYTEPSEIALLEHEHISNPSNEGEDITRQPRSKNYYHPQAHPSNVCVWDEDASPGFSLENRLQTIIDRVACLGRNIKDQYHDELTITLKNAEETEQNDMVQVTLDTDEGNTDTNIDEQLASVEELYVQGHGSLLSTMSLMEASTGQLRQLRNQILSGADLNNVSHLGGHHRYLQHTIDTALNLCTLYMNSFSRAAINVVLNLEDDSKLSDEAVKESLQDIEKLKMYVSYKIGEAVDLLKGVEQLVNNVDKLVC